MTILNNLLKDKEVENLFKELSDGSPTAAEELLKKLDQISRNMSESGDSRSFLEIARSNIGIPYNINLTHIPQKYIENIEDIWQEFLIKVQLGVIKWDPKRGSLRTYVNIIFTRLWQKKLHQISHKKEYTETELGENFRIELETSSQSTKIPYLKESRIVEIAHLSIPQRLSIKLARPYLFRFKFEQDEKRYLKQKTEIEFKVLLKQIKEEMHSAACRSKVYISPKIVAKWMGISENSVSSQQSRVRRKMPWLRNIKNELEIDE